MKKCPFCDEMIDDNLSVCPICGEDLPETPSSEQTTVMEEPVERELRECPICGEMIDASLDVCDICGEPTHFHDVQDFPEEEPLVAEDITTDEPEEIPEETTVIAMPEPENIIKAEEITETITQPVIEEVPEPEPVTIVKQETPVPPIEQPTVRQPLPEEKKKSNRGFIIGIIALLLLAILGLLYLLFFKGDKSEKATEETTIQQPVETNAQDVVQEKSIQELLDSLQKNLNEDVIFVAKYPDEDRACMYYIFNGELFKYNALDGSEETINVPMDAETDMVFFAEPEGDGQYIKIDMVDENMEHTAFYRLNTLTGKILREKEGGPEPQEPTAVDDNKPGEMPPPPPAGGNSPDVKKPATQKQAAPPPARNKVRQEQRPEEDVSPTQPTNNGPGYRLEPIKSGDIPKGNNNGGYHY